MHSLQFQLCITNHPLAPRYSDKRGSTVNIVSSKIALQNFVLQICCDHRRTALIIYTYFIYKRLHNDYTRTSIKYLKTSQETQTSIFAVITNALYYIHNSHGMFKIMYCLQCTLNSCLTAHMHEQTKMYVYELHSPPSRFNKSHSTELQRYVWWSLCEACPKRTTSDFMYKTHHNTIYNTSRKTCYLGVLLILAGVCAS